MDIDIWNSKETERFRKKLTYPWERRSLRCCVVAQIDKRETKLDLLIRTGWPLRSPSRAKLTSSACSIISPNSCASISVDVAGKENPSFPAAPFALLDSRRSAPYKSSMELGSESNKDHLEEESWEEKAKPPKWVSCSWVRASVEKGSDTSSFREEPEHVSEIDRLRRPYVRTIMVDSGIGDRLVLVGGGYVDGWGFGIVRQDEGFLVNLWKRKGERKKRIWVWWAERRTRRRRWRIEGRRRRSIGKIWIFVYEIACKFESMGQCSVFYPVNPGTSDEAAFVIFKICIFFLLL